MRLTLRTLLAWMDEVLGADEQRELGEKVAASEVAPRLAERIGDVVASPALAAPQPTGRGLADDPNTTAEFLDNVLEPGRLEAFERVCIESDVHLADVAGCHRILAEVVRDPAAVEPLEQARGRAALDTARRRLREATPAADGIRVDAAAPRPAARVGGPQQRRRAPLAAWLSAAVAALLLAGLVGMLAWTLLRPRAPQARQAATPAPAAGEAAREPEPNREPEPEPELVGPAASDPPPANEPPAVPAAATVADEESPSASPEPAAPAVEQAAAPAPGNAAAMPERPSLPPERSVPFGDALALGGGLAPSAPLTADPSAGDAPAGAPAATPPPAADGATLVDGAILVRPAGTEDAWMAATASGPLATQPGPLDLIAPAWSYPVVRAGGATLRLHPGAVATLSCDAGGVPRLALAHGRVCVVGGGTDLRLAVQGGGLEGLLTGPAGRSAGIEVTAADRLSADPAVTPPLRVAIHPVGPATTWRQAAADGTTKPLIGIPVELLIPQANALLWDGRDPAVAAVVAGAEPAWLDDAAAADRTQRTAAAEIAAALAAAPAGSAAADGLRRQLESTRSENRMAAAATLASLGDPEPLADLLGDDSAGRLHEHQWRQLAETTLPAILARGGAAAAALLAAIEARADAGCGAELVALARGLDAIAPPATRGQRLVDDLDSPCLAVRRFAILRLHELVPAAGRAGDDYRADRSALLRADSVTWWRDAMARAAGGGEAPPATVSPRRDPE